MKSETAWLIEHPHDPRYGRESWYAGKEGFTIDSLQAVRYARKEDAEREIDRFPISLAKNLRAEEHAWIPAPSAEEAGQAGYDRALHDIGYTTFDPVNTDPALRSSIRDCIHGRHARKCPECDLVIELRESAESARKLIRLARRAVTLWQERPFEDCPLNQIMNMLHVAATGLEEHFPPVDGAL